MAEEEEEEEEDYYEQVKNGGIHVNLTRKDISAMWVPNKIAKGVDGPLPRRSVLWSRLN